MAASEDNAGGANHGPGEHRDNGSDTRFASLYDELRRRAAAYLREERVGHTLQPTALVHEAWVRLADATRAEFADRTHYLALAAIAMRRVLIDHARGKGRAKRGGGAERVTLTWAQEVGAAEHMDGADLLALDEALEKLAALDPRHARIVEMRFFAGMTVQEAAAALGVSAGTVESDWRMARAWLRRELGGRNSGDSEGGGSGAGGGGTP